MAQPPRSRQKVVNRAAELLGRFPDVRVGIDDHDCQARLKNAIIAGYVRFGNAQPAGQARIRVAKLALRDPFGLICMCFALSLLSRGLQATDRCQGDLYTVRTLKGPAPGRPRRDLAPRETRPLMPAFGEGTGHGTTRRRSGTIPANGGRFSV